MKLPKSKYFRYAFFGVIITFVFLLPEIVRLYTDWLWFQEIQFQEVFTTTLKAELLIGLVFGILVFGFIYLNTLLFRHLTKNAPINVSINRQGRIEMIDVSAIVSRVTVPIITIIAFLSGLVAASKWQIVLVFLNQASFGSIDPIFGRDIAFYVFSLPFIQLLISFGFFVLSVSLVVVVLLYVATGALVIKNWGIMNTQAVGKMSRLFTIGREAKIHLSILVAIWFGLSALKIYFTRIPNLLYSASGTLFGASYTDINATLPFLYVLLVVSILGVLLSFWEVNRKGVKLIAIAFFLYAGTSVLGGWLYPTLLQNIIVKPNELVKETPYLEHHISATQAAWGLDKVEKRDLVGESALTMVDVEENEATIKNIRLWDRGPLLDTFGQLQEIRTYYDFVSIDNDRYTLDGEYRQVLLSPRELNIRSLPQRNFINERLTFTHGMGVTLGPVNEVTKEGLPVLFIQDLPPESSISDIEILQPEIYYGELSSDYVFVNTRAKEFDYPSGEENVYSTYEGEGGVKISSLFRKALFAWRHNSLKVFLSNDITRESKILYYRDIRERAQKALPFLEFDNDPYLVIDDGRLKWIYDGYTKTSKYPYSLPVDGGKNYMRNSVKVIIDAYDGTLDAYIADVQDPLIQTFANIYPSVMKPLSEIPESLREHLRYPEDIFTYQTALYTIYHMEQPQIFYNKEDLWEIPVIQGGSSDTSSGPIMRHLIMKLPGESDEEFILMLPFTPRGKNNMSAWMVVRSDGDNYGELVVYRFPKQSLVFGPKQIVDRINQDAEISRQISLWDQRGSQVIQGNLFVIPINESILYVRPLYLRAEGGKIPELKRVIVAYENQIAMEETLEGALLRIFSNIYSDTSDDIKREDLRRTQSDALDSSQSELIRLAQEQYDRAQAALRQGDWALYGEEMESLREILQSLGQ